MSWQRLPAEEGLLARPAGFTVLQPSIEIVHFPMVCKTVYPGSIPGVASNKIKDLEFWAPQKGSKLPPIATQVN
jgi:hypothetical protein